MSTRVNTALAALALASLAPAAHASVSCSVAADPLAFGAYTAPGGSTRDSTSQIRVTCTASGLGLTGCSSAFKVRLATGSSGSFNPRTLLAGASPLAYNLYTDAARSIVWDSAASGASIGSGNFSAAIINLDLLGLLCDSTPQTFPFTVYGRVPGLQNVPAGSYSDSILVTLEF